MGVGRSFWHKMKLALTILKFLVVALVAVGVILVASASGTRAETLYGKAEYFAVRQLVWVGIAGMAWLVMSRIDYRIWLKHRGFLIFCCTIVVILLALVVCPGIRHQVNGSYRWLRLGPLNVQPSEFAKLFAVIALSVWLEKIGTGVYDFWKGVVIPGVGLGLVAGLLFLEPDYGSIMVIGVTSILIMIVTGVRWRYIVPMGALAAMVVLAVVLKDPNRARRLAEFMEQEPPYQVQQSLNAFKMGGLWGVGYTNSIQKHKYLPEAHTDFIFAIGGEELGFFFSIAIVMAYAAFLVCGFYISVGAADRLGRIMAFGMTFLITFQALWNIAMVTKTTITKGLALPFISYGGTNLVVALVAVAVLINIGQVALEDSVVKNAMVKV